MLFVFLLFNKQLSVEDLQISSCDQIKNSILILLTVMWTEKRYNEQQNWQNGSNVSYKPNTQQTPRAKLKPGIPLPNSRRSITPSRVQERVTASPLRVPLQRAIQKCTRDKSVQRPNSKSRMTNKSSRPGDSSIVLRRGIFENEQPIENNKRAHTQTLNFLKKYFDFDNPIPLQNFIDRIVQDYGQLWDNQNLEQLMDHFSYKMAEMFGDSVNPRELISVTRDNGIIGLILQIFQSINQTEDQSQVRGGSSAVVNFSKSPNIMSLNKSFEEQLSECVNLQHLKNIIQQFMQLMYQQMQKQLYSKFNAQMKRMVLKYRDAERMLKKVQEKLTMHADYFQAQQKWQRKLKLAEEAHLETKKKLQKIEDELKKQKELMQENKNIRNKLQEENLKLKENLEKFQNILINKLESYPNSDTSLPSTSSIPSLSRKLTSNGALMDRTQQFANQGSGFVNEPKPFQIKIDTHFIQRDIGPPITQTTTTFMDQNFNGPPPPSNYPMTESKISPITYSPIKLNNNAFDSGRPSFEGGIKPGTKIGDYTYSPYQNRSSRPF